MTFTAWLKDTGQRAARTFCQALIASGLVDASMTGLHNWKIDFTTAGLAAAAAVLHAVVDNVQVTPTVVPHVDVNLSTSAMGLEPPQGA